MTTQSASSKNAWTPHPYQIRAIRLLLSQAAAGLFLDPGLGKTSTVLAAIKILKEKGLITRVLIVAPLRPMQKTWPDEIRKWEDFQGMTWTILHGAKKEENLKKDVDIYLINPEGLTWLFAQRGLPSWEVLVIDESTKFKNSQTQRFKSLKNFLPLFQRRWILTGTPTPNGLMDLFGQMYVLDLGRSLGRYITHYRREFFLPTGYGGYSWAPMHDAFGRIVERISPLILQLGAEDYLKMPKLVSGVVDVTLPPSVRKIYMDVENEFFSEWEGGNIVVGTAASAGVKCRQIANGAVYYSDREWKELHDAKLDALDDLLEEIGGHPVLILYEFEHDKERILQRYPGIEVLGGGLSEKKLNSIVDRFNAGKLPYLLGHPASMGHGLNLQGACHHVVWFGIPWNYEYYDQAISRVYRQGQESEVVFVYHIAAEKTLDQAVLKELQRKERDEKRLLGAISRYRQEQLERA